MEEQRARKVMIYDEPGFSRVCSAILDSEGYGTDIMYEQNAVRPQLNSNEVGIFITSYPYGACILDEVRKRGLPTIILYDNLDKQIVDIVLANSNLYCMIKPLDYKKFKGLVKSLLSGEQVSRGEYGIV